MRSARCRPPRRRWNCNASRMRLRMDDERPRVIGAFTDYNEMIAVLRARAAELNLSGEAIDAVSGLPARYAQKLLGPHQVRRLGAISLGPFLGALAARCLIVEDRA